MLNVTWRGDFLCALQRKLKKNYVIFYFYAKSMASLCISFWRFSMRRLAHLLTRYGCLYIYTKNKRSYHKNLIRMKCSLNRTEPVDMMISDTDSWYVRYPRIFWASPSSFTPDMLWYTFYTYATYTYIIDFITDRRIYVVWFAIPVRTVLS